MQCAVSPIAAARHRGDISHSARSGQMAMTQRIHTVSFILQGLHVNRGRRQQGSVNRYLVDLSTWDIPHSLRECISPGNTDIAALVSSINRVCDICSTKVDHRLSAR